MRQQLKKKRFKRNHRTAERKDKTDSVKEKEKVQNCKTKSSKNKHKRMSSEKVNRAWNHQLKEDKTQYGKVNRFCQRKKKKVQNKKDQKQTQKNIM